MSNCVQFVPYQTVHKAAIAIKDPNDNDHRLWQDDFEVKYNVKFGNLQISGSYTMLFPSDEDYTMFMLKWS